MRPDLQMSFWLSKKILLTIFASLNFPSLFRYFSKRLGYSGEIIVTMRIIGVSLATYSMVGKSCETTTQCVKAPFLVQKLQILEKLEKWSIFISVSKLIILAVKNRNAFEFSRLNWSKIVISWFYWAILASNF